MSINQFSRSYNRGSVTTPGQKRGRKTFCDGCDRVKLDCLFVEREGGSQICLCSDCRQKPWAKGKIRHADPDFPSVEL
jgi:hypothetical protein